MIHSYPGYREAQIGCHIYDLFPGADREKVIGLLEGAVQRNPYHAGTWRRVAQAVADGVVPQKKGEQMYDVMLTHFAEYPDLTFEVLEKILTPRFKAGQEARRAEIQKNLGILEKAFQIYARCQRPDLAVMLRGLQGRYLEAVGDTEKALQLYVLASEQYAQEHYGFLALFDRALQLMQDKEKKMKYIRIMVEKVPEYPSSFQKEFKIKNEAFVHVVQAYIQALKDAGKTDEASKWEARLSQ